MYISTNNTKTNILAVFKSYINKVRIKIPVTEKRELPFLHQLNNEVT